MIMLMMLIQDRRKQDVETGLLANALLSRKKTVNKRGLDSARTYFVMRNIVSRDGLIASLESAQLFVHHFVVNASSKFVIYFRHSS